MTKLMTPTVESVAFENAFNVKRQSTTAKVTRTLARAFDDILDVLDYGYLVRYKGRECGVVNVNDDNVKVMFGNGLCYWLNYRELTIPKHSLPCIEEDRHTIDNADSNRYFDMLLS